MYNYKCSRTNQGAARNRCCSYKLKEIQEIESQMRALPWWHIFKGVELMNKRDSMIEENKVACGWDV